MRSVAIARYRVLTSIRSARWIFLVALVGAVLPLIAAGGLLFSTTVTWMMADVMLRETASAAVFTYALHLLILLSACELFGTRRRAAGADASDLTDTVPITAGGRFAGDAMGIFVCTIAVHFCTLPLLALAVVLSPLSTAAFWWLELLTLALTILGATAGAWKFHSTSRWPSTQTTRNTIVFAALLLSIFYFTTRWQDFRDAFWMFVSEPSPYWWKPVAAAVTSPVMLFASLLLLYFGFIGYYAAQSVRSLERR